ncbi:orotidine-5'-phosphate decarboxylase [Pleurocapsa sp. PCC 7319]|uniref:orotidine-5'-phosphate decarboxylase n=1 Tax=Pleurocapsa sp. PCC 7319 TaxID=118161 RepID=UPI00034A3D65|nr:orotidine-5'-phosphate decarboxylase [Pleurocapsa sp. PCC 7319]
MKKLFIDRLIKQIKLKNTSCIVGLDPALERMPDSWKQKQGISQESSIVDCAEAIYQYNLMVLDAIADLVPAVKPQSAYYELFGSAGFVALEKTIMAARDRGLLVILDVKRGDIASTATAYARSYLSSERPRPYEADAITIVPYLGEDCLEPFFKEANKWGKGVFVCVKTSNPGAAIVQEQKIDNRYLYEIIADLIKPASDQSIGKSGYSGIGAVVGATYPEAAYRLRQQLPNSLFLVPGVGAQGGGNEGIKACFNSDGLGAVVSSSRAIMYPHQYGSADSNQETIRQAALDLIAQVQEILNN